MENAAITGGTLTVPHHAAVVLTAQPSSGAYLTGWMLDGEAEGNALTFNLNNVTKDHTIDAAFGVSQMVTLTTVCGDGGKLTVKRADGTTIDASGGIQVPKGAPLTLTAAPDSGKMVQAWTVNDTAADELSNTFTLTPTENSKVQVDFENVTLLICLPTTQSIPSARVPKHPMITARNVRFAKAARSNLQCAPQRDT